MIVQLQDGPSCVQAKGHQINPTFTHGKIVCGTQTFIPHVYPKFHLCKLRGFEAKKPILRELRSIPTREVKSHQERKQVLLATNSEK